MSRIRFWVPLGTSCSWDMVEASHVMRAFCCSWDDMVEASHVFTRSNCPPQKMTDQVRMMLKIAGENLSGGFPSFRPQRAKPLLILFIKCFFENDCLPLNSILFLIFDLIRLQFDCDCILFTVPIGFDAET